MINDKEQSDKLAKQTTSLSTKTSATTIDDLMAKLDKVKELVEYIAKDSTLSKPFEDKILDELTGECTGVIVNKNNIISALLLAEELGLSPMKALTLGKMLNADAVMKVELGKSLGLSPFVAIKNISIIPSMNGSTYHIGTHIMRKVMLDNGVNFKVLCDFEPIYSYVKYVDNKVVDSALVEAKDSKYVIVTGKLDLTDTKKYIAEGKTPVKKAITDRVTEIEFDRPSKGLHHIERLTLQNCTDMDYYPGYHSTKVDDKGNPLYMEGRGMWKIGGEKIQLLNRTFTFGARVMIGDKLLGTLSNDEGNDYSNSNLPISTIEEEVIDITASQTANLADKQE